MICTISSIIIKYFFRGISITMILKFQTLVSNLYYFTMHLFFIKSYKWNIEIIFKLFRQWCVRFRNVNFQVVFNKSYCN